MKRKVLQFLADLIIKSLEHEKNERAFESLMKMGVYLDFYATEKGIYLD
jgi:hypothetical protein